MMVEFAFYNARGNKYFVATPENIRELVALPETAAEAARSWSSWTEGVVKHVRADPRHANGVLVGPFPADDGFGLLIVNTNGDLAEFSGNGLTIFSQFLVDEKKRDRFNAFFLHVHHDLSKPVKVRIKPEDRGGKEGFCIYMTPTFGRDSVKASSDYVGASELNGRHASLVFALAQIDAAWTCSQFVSVGNPHCVTFLQTADSLDSLEERESDLETELTAIANSSIRGETRGNGRPCENGINLQWAFVVGSGEIHARVFERGEGWTESSGSSATAVASAARHLGLVTEPVVFVTMPGGRAPVHFDEDNERVILFGEAERVP